MLNKFELSKKLDIVPLLRAKNQRKLLVNVASQMNQIENS